MTEKIVGKGENSSIFLLSHNVFKRLLLSGSLKVEVFLLRVKDLVVDISLYFQVFVDDSAKDEKYWQRRKKNNVAAKRSREARRVKENQIAMRAAFLEQENDKLRKSYEKLQRENEGLVKRLSKYEPVE